MEAAHAGVDQEGGEVLRFPYLPPARDLLLGGEAHGDGIILAGLFLHRPDRLQGEPEAPGQATAVRVGAAVAQRRQERPGEHVAVSGVELDAVKAGSARAKGGIAELSDGRAYLFNRKLPAFHPGEVVHDTGGRSQRNRAVEQGGQRFGAGVCDLGDDARAVGMDGIREAFQSRYEGIVPETDGAGDVGRHGVYGAHLEDDEADAAPGPGLVVVYEALRHRAVALGEIGRHGRHGDPVLYLHRPDRYRAEQRREFFHAITSEKK